MDVLNTIYIKGFPKFENQANILSPVDQDIENDKL